MTHADLIKRLREYEATFLWSPGLSTLFREAADALEAITGDEAVKRGARVLDADAWEMTSSEFVHEYGSAPPWSSQRQKLRRDTSLSEARAVLNAATGDA